MKKSTTEQGYGHVHQQRRKQLLARLVDGDPCSWCGRPMYRDKEKNFDGRSLHADHGKSLKNHGQSLASELLHGYCNVQKGADREHLRPGRDEPPMEFDWTGFE